MPNPLSLTCALKIDTQTGWHKSLIKLLTNINGVTYSIDAQQGVAYISGKVDPGKILKMLAKSGKHAELCWIDSGQNPNRVPFNNGYHGYPNNIYDNGYNNSPNYYNTTSYGDPYYYNHNYMMHPELQYTPAPMSRATVPFYEPEPKYFPQPPPPQDGFNVGDPQWCSIM
ncbi:hypothetical protein Dsin_007764 [Dipteronia sinensis]|uniref:HMA domain-containing protein n=1 Tax=Dipteronia sinensis TaxID=43782 RepID=A0AAE0EHE1_9ROSI|nr:hypothetical protein Dsin_007764 [Dipteronia sinensis]